MKLFWHYLAVACIGAGLSTPASADTIATFTLYGVTFDDGGTAAGTFDYNVATGALSNVNITADSNVFLPQHVFVGPFTWSEAFSGFSALSNSNPPQFLFQRHNVNNEYWALAFVLQTSGSLQTEQNLANEPALSTANVVQGASFPIWVSNQHSFASFVAFETDVTAGSLDVTAVSTTPLPAALPLFATGLASLGFLARRRRKHAAA